MVVETFNFFCLTNVYDENKSTSGDIGQYGVERNLGWNIKGSFCPIFLSFLTCNLCFYSFVMMVRYYSMWRIMKKSH